MLSKSSKGFTLIELMVSVTIFIVIMVMSMGAILTVLNSNRKSDAIRSVMDDMNYTLDGMARTIRFSKDYHCGTVGTAPADCANQTALTVTFVDPLTFSTSYITYAKSGSSITKTVDGTTYTLTSPSVNIQNLSFWVIGSDPNDTLQPRVVIVVSGTAGQNTSQTSFNLQTTISQRSLDYK